MSAPVCLELASIAESGTASVTIPVSEYVQQIYIYVHAKYATVAATTGVQAAFEVSPDGSSFTASNAPDVVAIGAAATILTAEQVIRTQNDPFRQDGGPLESIKVNLTNLDASNAAVVSVSYLEFTHQP